MKAIPNNRSALELLEKAEPWMRETLASLQPARRERIEDFIRHMVLGGSSLGTIKRYLEAIRSFGNDGKPFEDLTEGDLKEWMQRLPYTRRDGRNGGRYHPSTVETMKRLGKTFLRWIHNGEDRGKEMPEVLRCIHIRTPKLDLRKDILSKEEIRRLVDMADRQRDRALIFVGYESGARAGELLSLRLRDVKLDRYGSVLLVKGKTGTRRIRLVQSVPDLQLWLSMHPLKGDPNAPIWVSRQRLGQSITKPRLAKILGTCSQRAKLGRRAHPHLLRHSRATHLASVLTEAQLREFFGWTKRSEVPAVYVHLSGRDIDSTLLKHYGIDVKEDREEAEMLRPVKCPRCRSDSPAGAKFCLQCGMALSQEAILAHKEVSEIGEELIELLIKRLIAEEPEKLEKFLRAPEFRQRLAKIAEI